MGMFGGYSGMGGYGAGMGGGMPGNYSAMPSAGGKGNVSGGMKNGGRAAFRDGGRTEYARGGYEELEQLMKVGRFGPSNRIKVSDMSPFRSGAPRLMTAGSAPAMRNPMREALQSLETVQRVGPMVGKTADFFLDPATKEGSLKSYLNKYLPEDKKDGWEKASAHGGRIGYQGGGFADDDEDGIGGRYEDLLRADASRRSSVPTKRDIPTDMGGGKEGSARKLAVPGQPPSTAGLGAGDQILGGLKIASAIPAAIEGISALGTGLSSLLAFLPFSDERVKENMRPVGKLYDGQMVYSYNLHGGPTQIGLKAQDVEKNHKNAVHTIDGIKHVDYDEAVSDAVKLAKSKMDGGRIGYANGGDPESREVITLDASTPEGGGDWLDVDEKEVIPVKPKTGSSIFDAPRKFARAGEKEGRPQEWSEFLSSRQFLQPLAEGLAAAAASPSYTAPGAILTGLGGYSRGYSALEAQQKGLEGKSADIEKRQAETGLTREQALQVRKSTATGSLITDSQGRRVLFYYEGNTPKMIPLGEAYDRMEKGETFNLEPSTLKRVKVQVSKELGRPEPFPKEPETPVTPPVTPTKKVDVSIGDDTGLPPDALAEAKKWAKIQRDKGTGWLASLKDVYTPQQDKAAGAIEFRSTLNTMGGALSNIPKKGGLSAGSLSPILTPLAGYLNSVSNTLGFNEFISPKDLANSQEALKYISRLREVARAKNDLRAVSSLNQLAEGYPSLVNTKEAASLLLAGMHIENQKEIDKNDFYQKFKRTAEGPVREALAANKSGGWFDLNSMFERGRDPIYKKEKEAIERMYSEVLSKKDKNGREVHLSQDGKTWLTRNDIKSGKIPITLAAYLSKYASKLNENNKKSIEKEYGKGILRYWGLK